MEPDSRLMNNHKVDKGISEALSAELKQTTAKRLLFAQDTS